MLTIETELIAAIKADVGIDFVENRVVEDGIELSEHNNIVWRQKANFLYFRAREKHICSQKNSRSLMEWLKIISSSFNILCYTLARREMYWNRKFLLNESSSNSNTSDCTSLPSKPPNKKACSVSRTDMIVMSAIPVCFGKSSYTSQAVLPRNSSLLLKLSLI